MPLYAIDRDFSQYIVAVEYMVLWMIDHEIFLEQIDRFVCQNRVPVLFVFAVSDKNSFPAKINIIQFQVCRFGDTQSRRVDQGKYCFIFQACATIQ